MVLATGRTIHRVDRHQEAGHWTDVTVLVCHWADNGQHSSQMPGDVTLVLTSQGHILDTLEGKWTRDPCKC